MGFLKQNMVNWSMKRKNAIRLSSLFCLVCLIFSLAAYATDNLTMVIFAFVLTLVASVSAFVARRSSSNS